MADRLSPGSALNGVLIERCDEVTPHDTNPLAFTTIALSVNVSGLVKVRFAGSSADITRYMLAGIDYPWRVTHVRSTGTDAATITGKIFGAF